MSRFHSRKPLNDQHPALAQFRGSLDIYKHEWVLLTPGVFYIAETFEAWWFIDLITYQQLESPISSLGSQIWRLEHLDPGKSVVTCFDGDGAVFLLQEVETAFPPPGVELWCDDLVIYLPNER